jgi:hypothetical protein
MPYLVNHEGIANVRLRRREEVAPTRDGIRCWRSPVHLIRKM